MPKAHDIHAFLVQSTLDAEGHATHPDTLRLPGRKRQGQDKIKEKNAVGGTLGGAAGRHASPVA